GGLVEMGDAVDDIICATDAAVAVEDAASGKPAMLSSLGGQGEEEHEEKDNEDKSGESEVINPPEDAGGEATSPLEGLKPRLSKGNQSHGPNAVKSKSPTSGDEGQTRKKAPNSSLPKAPIVQVSHGDAGVGSNKDGKNESRSSSVDATLLDDSKEKRKTQKPLLAAFHHMRSEKRREVTPVLAVLFADCLFKYLEEKIHAREYPYLPFFWKMMPSNDASFMLLTDIFRELMTDVPYEHMVTTVGIVFLSIYDFPAALISLPWLSYFNFSVIILCPNIEPNYAYHQHSATTRLAGQTRYSNVSY
ncbi:hypothetical protein ACJX0J_022647, partial [Zea mays]